MHTHQGRRGSTCIEGSLPYAWEKLHPHNPSTRPTTHASTHARKYARSINHSLSNARAGNIHTHAHTRQTCTLCPSQNGTIAVWVHHDLSLSLVQTHHRPLIIHIYIYTHTYYIIYTVCVHLHLHHLTHSRQTTRTPSSTPPSTLSTPLVQPQHTTPPLAPRRLASTTPSTHHFHRQRTRPTPSAKPQHIPQLTIQGTTPNALPHHKTPGAHTSLTTQRPPSPHTALSTPLSHHTTP